MSPLEAGMKRAEAEVEALVLEGRASTSERGRHTEDSGKPSVLDRPLMSSRTMKVEIQNEKAWHRQAALLLATGCSQKRVASALGVSVGQMAVLMTNQWFRELISQIIAETTREAGALDIITANVSIASLTLLELTQSAKSESVRLSAATSMLDRVFGRSVSTKEADPGGTKGRDANATTDELTGDIQRLLEETQLLAAKA